jgi:uncharacterized membrane protein
MTKVLLVGESWVSSVTHFKGFDQFGSVTFHLGAKPLVAALGGVRVRPHLHEGPRGRRGLPLRHGRA